MTVRNYTDFFDAQGSTAINWVAYNNNTREMFVKWRHGDTVSGYAGVEPSTYEALIESDSVGSFVAHHIKNKYLGVQTSYYDTYQPVRDKSSRSRPASVVSDDKVNYKVSIELSGALQFEVSGTDIADALRAIDAVISKSLADGASYRVTKVEAT